MGNARRVHLDTIVVISIITGDKYFRDLQKVPYDLARWDYEIVVTHVVVGEALAVLMKRYPDAGTIDGYIHEMVHMFRKYHISVEGCVVPVRDGSHAIAVRLHDMDVLITGNDLAITAQALADPDAVALITRDSVLPNSDAIRKCEEELRDNGDRNRRMKVVQGAP